MRWSILLTLLIAWFAPSSAQASLGDSVSDLWDSPITWTGGTEPRSLLSFRAHGLTLQQQGGAQLTSGLLSWNPALELSEDFGLVGSLGVLPLRLSTASGMVYGLLYGLMGSWFVSDQFSMEAGVGRQDWGAYSRAGFDYQLNLRLAVTGGVLRALVVNAGYFDRPAAVAGGSASPVLRLGAGLEITF